MPPVREHPRERPRIILRLSVIREEIMRQLRDRHRYSREAVIEDSLRPIGSEHRPRRQWSQSAVNLIVWLYRLRVSTQEITRQLNVYGWVVDHAQIIRALKVHESRSMAADPDFVW